MVGYSYGRRSAPVTPTPRLEFCITGIALGRAGSEQDVRLRHDPLGAEGYPNEPEPLYPRPSPKICRGVESAGSNRPGTRLGKAVQEPSAILKADLPRLKQRAVLLNRAILYASISAIFATLLVIVAFVTAFFGIQHERGIAVLFVVTLGFFAAALVNLARETRIGLHEFDYY
jgi:Protein of unknown function (DUF2721)